MPFDKKVAVDHIMHNPKKAANTFISLVTTGGVDVGLVRPRKRKPPEPCVSGVKMTISGAGRAVTGREK